MAAGVIEVDGHTYLTDTHQAIDKDLNFLAKKLGISLEQLRKERILEEQKRIQEEREARYEKRRKSEEARRKALEKYVLDHYGKNLFVTLNGRRISKVKGPESITCGHCGNPLLNVFGYLCEMGERLRVIDPRNPPLQGVPVFSNTLTCPGCKENNAVLIQMLL